MATRRVTMREAADILGVSKEAIRKRVIRGTLQSEAGEDGRRYVFLDTGTDEATTHEPGALISEMRERIGLLERELEEAHAANRENRRIIAALTSRIPELPAPSSPDERESSETVAHQMPMGAEPSEAREEAQEVAQPRSWWRRVFGG